MQRVLIRHIPEQATQRLLVEKGDIDIARNLGPDQIKGLEGNPDVRIHSAPEGGIFYLGLNQWTTQMMPRPNRWPGATPGISPR